MLDQPRILAAIDCRITQPRGLRVTYLLMQPGLNKGETKYSPERTAFLFSRIVARLMLPRSSHSIRFEICNDGEAALYNFLTQVIA